MIPRVFRINLLQKNEYRISRGYMQAINGVDDIILGLYMPIVADICFYYYQLL